MIRNMFMILAERPGFFLSLTIEHLRISLLAIGIAFIVGLVLGVLISEFGKASGPVLALVNIIYTIPSISLLGFLIPFSGIGNKTAIIALTVYALLPMVRNTHSGLTGIDPAVIQAARGMGSTRWQILYKISLPLALPTIFTGLRSMAIMTIALAGIASFIGAGGLGVAIYRGITTNNMAMTLAGSLLIALLAFVVDLLLAVVEKGFKTHWRAKWRIAVPAVAAVLVGALLVSPYLGGTAKSKTVQVATKPMTEQYILGEMLRLMIEQDTDLTVEVTQGVGGGTANIQPGMESGAFDLYPEYTGTGWNAVLLQDGIYDESMFGEMQREYEAMGLEWAGMYGFNNTYGIALRRDIAEEHGIETYSGLAAISDTLVLGAEYDFFEREDGYAALTETYGLTFGGTMDMDISLKYQAINGGEVDVIVIATTDGQLSVSDVVVLVDDKQMYPSYLCGNVVRTVLLEEEPELRAVLERLEGTITDEEMAHMNYLVETEEQDPADVARDHLQQKGLLAASGG